MVRGNSATGLNDILGSRLLVVGAHPDDCELMAGGLLAAWPGETKGIVVTSMRKSDPKKQRRREAEVRAAFEVLGVRDFEIGTLPDADLVHDSRLTRFVERALREFRPTVVVTHKPDDFHQDHRAISWGVEAALRRSEATLLHGESYLWPLQAPNLAVDISPVFKKKLAALKRYKSIIANKTFDPSAVEAFHRMRGSQSFRFRYAECFRLVRAQLATPPSPRKRP